MLRHIKNLLKVLGVVEFAVLHARPGLTQLGQGRYVEGQAGNDHEVIAELLKLGHVADNPGDLPIASIQALQLRIVAEVQHFTAGVAWFPDLEVFEVVSRLQHEPDTVDFCLNEAGLGHLGDAVVVACVPEIGRNVVPQTGFQHATEGILHKELLCQPNSSLSQHDNHVK